MQALTDPFIETAAEAKERLKREQELFAIDMRKFRDLMSRAASLLEQANCIVRLPDIQRTQALVAARLAGVTLHRMSGAPTKWNASALVVDFEFAVERVAEPLLTVLAEQAKENFNGVSADHFKDHLADALGDTRGEIAEAAEGLRS